MGVTLQFTIKPAAAAEVATIQVDGTPVVGMRLEVSDGTKRVHVSITAVGYRRYSKDVDVHGDTTLEVDLAKRPSKKKKTVAVTLGMGALGVLAWLVRRR